MNRRQPIQIIEADENSLSAEEAARVYPDLRASVEEALGEELTRFDIERLSVHIVPGAHSDEQGTPNEVRVFIPLR